jgi:hypothetical protein
MLIGYLIVSRHTLPKVSARVQLENMQAVVVCTSRLLEHWQVVFVKEHPAAGIVISKQASYANNQRHIIFCPGRKLYSTLRNLRNLLLNECLILSKNG